jgi:hypothetical protein
MVRGARHRNRTPRGLRWRPIAACSRYGLVAFTRSAAAPPCRAACRRSLSMAAARSVRRLRSAESANSRNTALRDVPRRVASASTSLRRSSGIDTMTFAMLAVYRGIRGRATAVGQPVPVTGASNCTWFARRAASPIFLVGKQTSSRAGGPESSGQHTVIACYRSCRGADLDQTAR